MIKDNLFMIQSDSTAFDYSIDSTSYDVTALRLMDVDYENDSDFLLLLQIEVTLSS